MVTNPEVPDRSDAPASAGGAELARLAATIGGLRAAVRQRQGESATIRSGADELHGLLLELQRHEFVQEPQPVSPRPVYGRILVFVRKVVYHLFIKWHARAVLQQQNSFNQSASRLLSELAQRQKLAAEEGARMEQQLRRLEEALLPPVEPVPSTAASGDPDREPARQKPAGAPG